MSYNVKTNTKYCLVKIMEDNALLGKLQPLCVTAENEVKIRGES